MELMEKPGFKNTMVGKIPEDWIFCSVGEAIEYGFIEKPIDGNHGNIHPKKSDFVESGIPFIMANNVFGNKVHINDCSYITKKQADNLQKGFSYTGDVLLTHKGTVGNVAIVGELPCEYIMLTPQVTYYRTKEKLNNKYLKGYFESNSFQKILSMLSGGGTRAYIGIVKQKELPLVFPPALEEQKAIAAALSDVDDLISNLDKLITKKKAIKQGAMQQLLTPPHKGGKRLAGFTGEWVETPLDDVAWYQEGPGLRKWQFTDKGIKAINITNLVNGYLDLDKTQRHISWDEFNKMYQHFEIDENDILVASSGNSYCKTAVVRKQDLRLVMNTSVIRFKPKENLDYKLLLIFLKSPLFKDQIDLLITGGAQPNFGPAHLRKIKIMLPPTKEEQSSIANILYDMEMEIEELDTKKAKYQNIKQGMMQELLTGKTRLV